LSVIYLISSAPVHLASWTQKQLVIAVVVVIVW